MEEKKPFLEACEITDEPIKREGQELPVFIENIVTEIYNEFHEETISSKLGKKLSSLVHKYPEIPIFKNYLYNFYQIKNKKSKARELALKIYKEHPNYIFARINYATSCLEAGNTSKALEALGEELELHALFPDYKVFHVTEVNSYYKSVISYLIAIGELGKAREKISFLENNSLNQGMELIYNDIAIAELKSHTESNFTIKVNPPKGRTSKTAPPVFNHAEVAVLYKRTFDFTKKEIVDLLSLPRKTLIEDLEKVIIDSIERYPYFQNKAECEKWKAEDYSFLAHAIFLLGELESYDSLKYFFEVLRQGEDYAEFYLSDLLTEGIYYAYVKLISTDNLHELESFVREPGIYGFHKGVITQAVVERALCFPAEREQIINWYRGLLEFFSQASVEDNVIDLSFIGSLISGIVDLRDEESLPLIKKMYDKGYVDVFICGDYFEIEEELKHYIPKKPLGKPLQEISEVYKEINEFWNEDEKEDDFNMPFFDSADTVDEINELPAESKIKAGRNDPCPCGSGKKYKKCCM
ncbi:MAG: SEC-C metal-binding domain-containing protein [Hyphomicrobiales bacterium]